MTPVRTRRRGARIVILAVMVGSPSVPGAILQAQSKPSQEITQEDIFALVEEGNVTTATKTERLLKTAPLAVTVITRQQLDAIGAVTISDALRLVPGVNARLSPMGGVFGIRSLGSTPFSSRVLILIDGVPYNSPDKGGLSGHPAYEDFFPIEHVKRIEVVKGPGSALYGQNAFQGVVNIITLDADDFGRTQVDFSGGVRDTTQFRLSDGRRREEFTYSFTAKYKRQEGPMEFQRDSMINSGDGYLKAGYKDFAVSYLFHRDTFDPFVFSSVPRIVRTLGTDQTLNHLVVSHEKRFSEQWDSKLRVSYNRRDGNTCANCHDSTGAGSLINGVPGTADLIQNQRETNQRYWINEQINWSPQGSAHQFVFGGEYQHDRTTKDIVQRLDRQRDISTAAAFAQDEMAFLDKRLIATLGARVDQNQLTGTSISPSVSLVYVPQQKLAFRGSFGRAFRQPTWNDFFISQRFLPTTIPFMGIPTEVLRVGNPDLKPEHISTVEGGAEYFFSAAYSLKLDTFYSALADYIQTENFSTIVGVPPFPPRPPAIGPGPPAILALASNRVNSIHTRGGEIEFRAKPNKYASVILSYAYQTHDLDPTVDSQAAYVPKHKVATIATIRPIEPLSLSLDMNSWSHFNTATPGLTLGRSPTAPGGVLFGDHVGDPYAVTNLNIDWLIVSNVRNRFGLAFQLRNLFDERVQQTPVPAVNVALRGREPFLKAYFTF